MSGGLAIGFYLIVYNRDRVDVVTGVTGLADCRGDVVLVPLALRLVHFLFFGLNGLRQAELRDVRIDLRLALDDYERVGTGLAPLAFQRRQRLVLLISSSPASTIAILRWAVRGSVFKTGIKQSSGFGGRSKAAVCVNEAFGGAAGNMQLAANRHSTTTIAMRLRTLVIQVVGCALAEYSALMNTTLSRDSRS